MFLSIVIVLGLCSVGGHASDFTINSADLIPQPSSNLRNGDQLELQCIVKLAKTSALVLNSTITFFMDDNKIYENSTNGEQMSYIIPKVRVSHTGKYKCEVTMEDRKKMSEEVDIQVTGLHIPHISVSNNEINEGDEVTVRCEAPEEWSYMKFTFYKISQKEEKKTKNTNQNYQEVKFMVKEGESILQFKCEVQISSTGETSPSSKIMTVTVVAPFSKPRIEVLPSLNFTEGKNMSVMCFVQMAPKHSDDMRLILQKDDEIIESSTTNELSFIRVAEVKDKGNYTCKVESKRTSKSSSAMIFIAELFPNPKLTLERSNKAEFIQEEESIVLKCSVDGLTPQAASKLEYIYRAGNTTRKRGNKLSMTVYERLSAVYICQVTISNITKESEPLSIQVYAPVKNPVLTHIINSNKTVVLGDTLELTCKTESGTPPITYSLLRGNDLLEKQTINNKSMEARFLVNSSMSHDLGQYRCQATNRNTQSSEKYSNIVNVTVIIPIDGVSLTVVQSNGDVEEGAELSIICRVKEGTLPIDFFFYRKKGKEILLNSTMETWKLFAVYQVFKFSKQDDGAYFCKASNRARKEVTSNSIEARAVLASWKKAVIGTFASLIILAAIAICAHFHMEKKKKGKDISPKNSRSSKSETTKDEKPAVELKAEGYYGSVKNENELHILRTDEESPGNDLQNHTEEHTEADGASPDALQDPVEKSENSTEDAYEANSHP